MELNRKEQSLRVGRHTYTSVNISQWVDAPDLPEPERALVRWLSVWWADDEEMAVQTSGSTGVPKTILVQKERMMRSAVMTIDYLNLGRSDTALLCMDLRYIGAMMLVVRALVAGMPIVVCQPSANPLLMVEASISFAPFVPLQMYEMLRHRISRSRLERIRCVIVGGGAIDQALEMALSTMPNRIYSTYGMTESLSHIALRQVTGVEASTRYTPLSGVTLSLTPQSTLRIEAPAICDGVLDTNDMVDLDEDNRFIVLGRLDNVINSGGVKIQLEQLERQMGELIPCPIALTWRADERFGQALVLIVVYPDESLPQDLYSCLQDALPAYHRPKQIIRLKELPRLPNGKVDRQALHQIAESYDVSM